MSQNDQEEDYFQVECRADLQSLYTEISSVNEELSYNILPSYQMFSHTVNKSCEIEFENNSAPPSYQELTNSGRCLGCNSLPTSTSQASLINSSSSQSASEATSNQENILNNVLKLNNITNSLTNNYSKSVKLSIVLTEDEGTSEFTELRAKSIEYSQTDTICGYVLIENTSAIPIPFEIFYVSLQGAFETTDKISKSHNREKFLEMIDLSASYDNPFNVRYKDTEMLCSIDEDLLQRNIGPKRVYKRFFSFKIPNRLLEDSCIHDCSTHIELPPTLGIRNVEASINYSIEAILIGKNSMYEHFDKNNTISNNFPDRYIVLKEITKDLRIVSLDTETASYSSGTVSYESLQDEIDFNLNSLAELESDQTTNFKRANSKTAYHVINDPKPLLESHACETASMNSNKSQERCYQYENFQREVENFQIICHCPVKTRKGLKKIIEDYFFTSPNVSYKIDYIKPPQYRRHELIQDRSWKFDIPFNLTNQHFKSAPIFKNVTAELVSLTIISKVSSIPVEINHNMVFQNGNELTFDDIVVKPMRRKLEALRGFAKRMEPNTVRMSSSLIRDLETISSLTSICVVMDVNEVKLTPTSSSSTGVKNKMLQGTYNISVDLTKSAIKYRKSRGIAYDSFCLIPSFQSCKLARIYFLKLKLECSNGFAINFKVPIEVKKNKL
ncbi:hypothetical protein CLIB1423_36S00738 [[Candida] railenensis]|uniref:Bul1 N-terminal domain-containing protein n=1 Tax=[Candida] railenensis TaxID=45579 RepID=A0A9P0QVS1_9ASCO|nr:hypothetical protein CLIB1423_36S00738 [[Candida] railenensis]